MDEIKERMIKAVNLAFEVYEQRTKEGARGFWGNAAKDPAIATLATKIYDELKEEEMAATMLETASPKQS